MKMATENQEFTSELLFLKYKGVPAPWEIIEQAKRYGFKCKKYANWKQVHVSENSTALLRHIGDLLIDSEELDVSDFSELMQIWERVQRWAKDKEGFSIEPDVLLEYENIYRLVTVGSDKPDVVDMVIDDFGYESDSLSLDDRWTLFLSICIYNFFHSGGRYQNLVKREDGIEPLKLKFKEFINSVSSIVVNLYSQIGFDIKQDVDGDVISLFIKEIGCVNEPIVTKRSAIGRDRSLPKVWVEKYEGGLLQLVKFLYTDGNVIVKLNKANKIFNSNDALGKLLVEEEFWSLIGNSLHSHVGQIEEIQDFFDTFARQIRLRK
jgi:hypothetical protein